MFMKAANKIGTLFSLSDRFSFRVYATNWTSLEINSSNVKPYQEWVQQLFKLRELFVDQDKSHVTIV